MLSKIGELINFRCLVEFSRALLIPCFFSFQFRFRLWRNKNQSQNKQIKTVLEVSFTSRQCSFTMKTQKKQGIRKLLSDQILTLATLGAVALGIVVGSLIRATSTSKWTARNIMYINFAGEIFLRMLKSLMLPLMMSSLIAAIGTLNLKASGRIGGRAITYYMITTVMAVMLGIILVLTIRPGVDRYVTAEMPSTTTINSTQPANSSMSLASSKLRNTTTVDTMLDLVRNMFPPNIIQACLEQFQTVLVPPPNATSSSELLDLMRQQHIHAPKSPLSYHFAFAQVVISTTTKSAIPTVVA